MKKKVLATALVSTILLNFMGVSALAVTGNTKGDVEFTKGTTIPPVTKPVDEDGPTVIEPEPPFPPIVTEEGLALTYAPSFNFGKVEINPMGAEYDVNQVLINEEGTLNTQKYYVPAFVQVVDQSGLDAKKWSVTVSQDTPLKSATNELTNTRIRLYGKTLDSNHKELMSDLASFEYAAGEKFAEIPVGGTALTVLESKTNGTYSSVVFENEYDGSTSPESSKVPTSSGVRLNVPSKDTPKAEKYTAKLTWTLALVP